MTFHTDHSARCTPGKANCLEGGHKGAQEAGEANCLQALRPWSKHRWVFKGSVGSRSRDMPLSELLGVLDSAEKKKKREFGAVIDLR